MDDSSQERKSMQQFLEWSLKNGAIFPKIEIRTYKENYRGVHALCDINAEERIMTIPLSMILTASIGWKTSSLGEKIRASGVHIDYPYCTYITCVLIDASKDSNHPFRPYYEIFPTNAATFPFFYTGEDLVQLQELSFASKQI